MSENDYEVKGQQFSCPVEVTLAVLGDRWKMMIVNRLRHGPLRFKELCELLGKITQKTVTLKLKELEEDHIITRTVYAEVPPRVEYALSDMGEKLNDVLDKLYEFGLEYVEAYGCKGVHKE